MRSFNGRSLIRLFGRKKRGRANGTKKSKTQATQEKKEKKDRDEGSKKKKMRLLHLHLLKKILCHLIKKIWPILKKNQCCIIGK